MASNEAPVVVVGAARLLGKTLAERLLGGGVPAERLRLSDTGARIGRLEEIGGEAEVVAEVDPDILALADQVFLCVPGDEATPLLEGRRGTGSLWIDLSGASSVRPRVPLVNLVADPTALPTRPAGLLAVPGAGAQLLSTLLTPVAARARLRRVRVLLHLPVSESGQEGLDELYQQTVALLNFAPVPRDTFGTQVAFNLLPAEPAVAERVRRETRRILRLSPGALAVSAVRAPVFHGHAVSVHLETDRALSPDEAAEALGAAEGVVLEGEDGVTPVEIAGREEIVAAPPVPDETGRGGLWLFAVADDLAAGSVVNAIRVAAACREG
jgi:aspartate-semialdehyde dehydrogenase